MKTHRNMTSILVMALCNQIAAFASDVSDTIHVLFINIVCYLSMDNLIRA